MEDWDTQETDLARELSGLNHRLADEFPDYSPTTEETEGWRAEFQMIQQRHAHLPPEAIKMVAGHLGVAPSEVYGVATFYNQFRFHPPGRHPIKVCLGTACHMKGSQISLEAWQRRLNINVRQTTPDGEFDLDTVACVGCCHLAPVTVVDGNAAGQVEPTKVDGILLGFGHSYGAKDPELK